MAIVLMSFKPCIIKIPFLTTMVKLTLDLPKHSEIRVTIKVNVR